MAENPALFVRVSTERGHSSVPRALAERDGSALRVLSGHDDGPSRPKPRKARQPRNRRVDPVAVITPEPEADSGETSEETS